MAFMRIDRQRGSFLVLLTILLGPHLCFGLTPDTAEVAWEQAVHPTGELLSLLEQSTLAMRDDGSTPTQRKRMAGAKAPAELHVLVVMCDFSDSLMLGRFGTVPGDFPEPRQSEFYYTAHDSVYFDHLMGDVAEYFRSISDDRFTLSFTILPSTVNLPATMAFYGHHPEQGEQPVLLAKDVVAALDPEVDFSPYDTMVLIHAGAGQETDILGDSPEQIFSTYLDPGDFADAVEEGTLAEPWLAGDDFGEGGGIDHVLLLPETEYQDPVGGYGGYFGSLGVYCFEVGLRLGMLSLSDFTPAGRPDSQGIGEFGLMGYGLFVGLGWIPPEPCAFNKVLMGWLDPVGIDPSQRGLYELTPVEDADGSHGAVRVDISGQEYWLLEYRLQDPDGNGIFSFSGDLNGDNIPDFFDADSQLGNGIPTGFFDPQTDTRELLTGAEWDFFMSENSAREPGVKGAGSGVYIWHVDEGVIWDNFDAESNLFNADADHKAVDLEEADGIQDLDSSIPSEFILGGDDDSYRGEGNSEFGPWTQPATESATGAVTGISFTDFSRVVADPHGYVLAVDGADTLWGIAYAPSMSFFLDSGEHQGVGPALAARVTLPAGVDLRGSHVLVGDLGGEDGLDEIILAGQAGEIYVLDGDLHEYRDWDGDPATIAPWATGTWNNQPVVWNLPPAMGDLDGDGQPEIILTAQHGIYAFKSDGTPLLAGDAANYGLWRELPDCSLPPILTPRLETGEFANSESIRVVVNVVVQVAGIQYFRQYGENGQLADPGVQLGSGMVVAPPVFAEGHFFIMARAYTTEGDLHQLDVVDVGSGNDGVVPPVHDVYPLMVEPGPWPVLRGIVAVDDQGETLSYVMVPGAEGSGETFFFHGMSTPAETPLVWHEDFQVASPLAPGGSCVGPDFTARIGHGGDWLAGWPAMLTASGSAASFGGPLVARLTGVESPLPQTLFPLRDGRILGLGAKGETLMGYPLAGPAACAGTPGLGDVRGGSRLDLVAVGTFERIAGLDGDTEELLGVPISTVMVWEDVAETDVAWPMFGGGIWRNVSYDTRAWTVLPGAQAAGGLVPGSHNCYPNPLREGALFVRGRTGNPGRARALVYNLEGELVTASAWRNVAAGDPFSLEVAMDGAGTGMYLCRLAVEVGGKIEYSVVSVAIVR